MKTNVKVGNPNPTATIAINKGRVKMYNKKSETPIFYLKKGQEFQIEIFNPTNKTILAKIKLNSELISQSGLVLRPGERVFLDRFFDVDKKFKFDTYEVSNTNEVKQAIQNNGDVEIMFYSQKEKIVKGPILLNGNQYKYRDSDKFTYYSNTIEPNLGFYENSIKLGSYTSDTTGGDLTFNNTSIASATLDMLGDDFFEKNADTRTRSVKAKKIETGRVEEGSYSNQKFKTVNIDFENFEFFKLSYKLIPISQKNVESKDLYKPYCTNCGAKAKAKDNFCSKCGRKL